MEAKALHNFTANSGDEISFRQNDVLKIISEEDKNWYKAEMNGHEGFVPANHLRFNPPIWYFTVTKEEAINILKAKRGSSYIHPDGSFLVRPSESNPGDLSLSIKIGDVQHYKVLRSDTKDKYFLWNDDKHFTSTNQLVAYYKTTVVSRTGPSIMLKELRLPKVKATFNFTPRSAEELEIAKDDIITVLDKNDVDWWQGHVERETKAGMQVQRGVFPCNYVVPISD